MLEIRMLIEEQKEESVDMTWQTILKEKKVISLEDFIEKRKSAIKDGYASAHSNFYPKESDGSFLVDLKDNHGNLQVRAYDKLKELGLDIMDYVVNIPSNRYIVTISKGTFGSGSKRHSDYFDDGHGYDSIDPNRLVE